MSIKKALRKYRFPLLSVFVITSYFVVAQVFPKSASRFPFFVVLFLLDIYLWNTLKKTIAKKEKFVSYTLSLSYWLPFASTIAIATISIFKPLHIWNTALFNYVLGLILIIYITKIFTALFILLADIVRIVQFSSRYVISKKKKRPQPDAFTKISRSRFLKKLGILSGGVVLSTMLVGRFKWAFDFRLREKTIHLPHLPQAFEGLKIIQFSDLHLGSWYSKEPIQDIVSIINAEKPDMVFFTGDLVNFSTREAFKYEQILKQIRAKHGIFAVLGNHDYGDYVHWKTPEQKQMNMQQLEDLYARMGWHLLRNQNKTISKKGAELAVLGVENWGEHKRFPRLGDVEKARRGVEQVGIKLLLSHDPSHWNNIVTRNFNDIDITFSGHTHGFQFGIETQMFRWSPAQYMYKNWAGLYKNDKQFLYVNRGAGYLGYPGRIGILPEITSIILRN